MVDLLPMPLSKALNFRLVEFMAMCRKSSLALWLVEWRESEDLMLNGILTVACSVVPEDAW